MPGRQGSGRPPSRVRPATVGRHPRQLRRASATASTNTKSCRQLRTLITGLGSGWAGPRPFLSIHFFRSVDRYSNTWGAPGSRQCGGAGLCAWPASANAARPQRVHPAASPGTGRACHSPPRAPPPAACMRGGRGGKSAGGARAGLACCPAGTGPPPRSLDDVVALAEHQQQGHLAQRGGRHALLLHLGDERDVNSSKSAPGTAGPAIAHARRVGARRVARGRRGSGWPGRAARHSLRQQQHLQARLLQRHQLARVDVLGLVHLAVRALPDFLLRGGPTAQVNRGEPAWWPAPAAPLAPARPGPTPPPPTSFSYWSMAAGVQDRPGCRWEQPVPERWRRCASAGGGVWACAALVRMRLAGGAAFVIWTS